MKVKRSVLKTIFKRFKKGVNSFKKKVNRIKHSLFKSEEEKVEKLSKEIDKVDSFLTVGISEDKSNLFYSIYDENEPDNYRLVSYDTMMKQYELSVKESIILEQEQILNSGDVEVDIYENKKYLVRKNIKDLYVKAKDFYISIDGYILKTNKIYRECVEAYRIVRNEFKTNYYEEIAQNDILFNFVKDNRIDLSNMKDNFEILLKLFIADVYTDLFDTLEMFKDMFDCDIAQ